MDKGTSFDAAIEVITASHFSAFAGYSRVSELLLDLLVNFNLCLKESTAPMLLATFGTLSITNIVLDRGGFVGAQNNSGEHALMGTPFKGGVAIIELLLERGEDVTRDV